MRAQVGLEPCAGGGYQCRRGPEPGAEHADGLQDTMLEGALRTSTEMPRGRTTTGSTGTDQARERRRTILIRVRDERPPDADNSAQRSVRRFHVLLPGPAERPIRQGARHSRARERGAPLEMRTRRTPDGEQEREPYVVFALCERTGGSTWVLGVETCHVKRTKLNDSEGAVDGVVGAEIGPESGSTIVSH